jgi:hypothetical protein
MFPLGVLWGYRDEEELRQAGAKRLIKYPAELLDATDEGRRRA